MTEAWVDIRDRDTPLHIRINGDDPTFVLGTDPLRHRTGIILGERELDLLDISSVVFAADSAARRGGATRKDMGAQWRREFRFRIEVRDPDHWARPEVSQALQGAVQFLTEDTVSFEFVARQTDRLTQPFLDLGSTGELFDADEIILFSGGLDSYAGALESLSNGNGKVVLVTHRSAQKAIPRQVDLGMTLAKAFPGRVLHVHVLARRKGQQASDNSQRSRSLLFAALGQAIARSFKARRVSFYENGIISHNLPLSPQIIGTMATRTTHPLGLSLLNDLMSKALDNPVPIENRYQWLTKTEVVRRIVENDGQSQITRTVSCTSIREQDSLHTHCGACSQCLDRRFGILAAGVADHDRAETYRTDVLLGARESTSSRTMATEWSRHMLRFTTMTPATFFAQFGPHLSRIILAYPFGSREETLRKILDMHRRQAEAVRSVLRTAIADHADQLATGDLPQSSLLILHVGQRPEMALADDPRSKIKPLPQITAPEELDLVPDPDDPLRVDFEVVDCRQVVKVEGLARIEGVRALVPAALLADFLDGRDRGLSPERYGCQSSGRLAEALDTSKATIRKRIDRIRGELEEAFLQVHGKPPESQLLIHRHPANGYRLDPTIEVIGTDVME